jgi:hypothetical protein
MTSMTWLVCEVSELTCEEFTLHTGSCMLVRMSSSVSLLVAMKRSV